MKIDMHELQKQRKKQMMDSGEYYRLEIVIPKTEVPDGEEHTHMIPYINLFGENVTPMMAYSMLTAVKDVEERLSGMPGVSFLEAILSTDTTEIKGGEIEVE